MVLSRKEGEKIYVGDDITITVLQVKKGCVRIGVQAPPDVPIERDDMNKTPEEPANGIDT